MSPCLAALRFPFAPSTFCTAARYWRGRWFLAILPIVRSWSTCAQQIINWPPRTANQESNLQQRSCLPRSCRGRLYTQRTRKHRGCLREGCFALCRSLVVLQGNQQLKLTVLGSYSHIPCSYCPTGITSSGCNGAWYPGLDGSNGAVDSVIITHGMRRAVSILRDQNVYQNNFRLTYW